MSVCYEILENNGKTSLWHCKNDERDASTAFQFIRGYWPNQDTIKEIPCDCKNQGIRAPKSEILFPYQEQK